jgi:putative hydrolase of the HAD superfamily
MLTGGKPHHQQLHRGKMKAEPLSAVVDTKKAIIFDLFHTLTALESAWAGGRPMTCELLGVSKAAWDEQLQQNSQDRLTGKKRDAFAIVAEMAHAIDPLISDDVIRAAVENRIARFAAALIHVPRETQEVLRRLRAKNKRIGLISNADVMEVAAWGRSPIAPFFDSVVFSCFVGCVKPERDIYEICMRQLEVTPGESVFVGDGGSRELEGARSLGITTVMVTGIIREIWPERIADRERHADFVIERLGELYSEGASA